MSSPWSQKRSGELQSLHGTMPIADLAHHFGVTRGSIRSMVTKLGLAKRDDGWSEAEVARLTQTYGDAEFGEDIGLANLSKALGRPKAGVCRKARQLGLTDISRPLKRRRKIRVPKYASDAERSAAMSAQRRRHIAENGHPRGMLGKKHSDATKVSLAASSRAFRASLSADQSAEIATKMMKTTVARFGHVARNIERGSWKAGWREIGGERKFYRSRWEANYARYLQWLQNRGDILDWKHEPETFWFDAIKRGVRSYLPDFRVWENDQTSKLHEVKGWMDARSKTTLRRMAKYHPSETIVLIRERDYRSIENKLGRLIKGWEWPGEPVKGGKVVVTLP